MKLIPDWKLAWRFLSVQAAVLLALLSGLQAEVLPLISPLFPEHVWPWVSGGLALAVVVLRLVSQDGLKAEREQLDMERELDALDAHSDAGSDGGLEPNSRLDAYFEAAILVALVGVLALMCIGVWAIGSAQ